MISSSWAAWVGLLAGLRAGTTDFALRPERWETRSTIPSVESVLRDPLSGPAAVDELGARVEEADGAAGLVAAAFESLGVVPATGSPVPAPPTLSGLPSGVSPAVGRLVAALTAARSDLSRAVSSLSPEDRVRARRAVDSAVGDDPFDVPRGPDFEAAQRFDLARLASAGIAAARAVDQAASELASAPPRAAFSWRGDSPIGEVVVSSGDAEIGADDISRAAVIVRLGGRTRYHGPAAAAGEGQIRVVLDLGGPAVIESTGSAAGAGELGIGLLYLLGPGSHQVDAGPASLGAARLGVGVAVIAGSGARVSSRRFGEGAAGYGVGVLETRGERAVVKAPLAAQGYGTTRGAGLWRHRGNDLAATCGFEVPDAREPLGSVSMGQGAGMGPRASAAGGVGVAFVRGNGARLSGSYFAQGSGYWHGFGALFVRGDGARLQSRRYGLGSGVHAAVGALDVQGRGATIDAWGVGPSFGWDYGVGLFRLRGDDARVRSAWANGRADLGSRSLSVIEGDRSELSLATAGTGSFTRAEAGYGLALVRGRGVRLRALGLSTATVVSGGAGLVSSPWGALRVEGDVALDPTLTLPDPVWPPTRRDERAAAEAPKAARLLDLPPNATRRERVARLLFAASTAILDTRPAESAALGLTALDEADAPALASVLDPDRFDELVWARVAAAGLGPAAARAAATEAAKASGVRRAALLDWLRFGRAEDVLPEAEKALRDPDWRLRRQAVSVIGSLFDDEGGEEPGRRRLLRDAAAGTATPERLGRKRLADLYSALALAGSPSPQERVALLAAAGTPFDAVSTKAEDLFAALVSSNPARAAALSREDRETRRLVERARSDLRAACADSDDEVAGAALLALGGLQNADDAAVLGDALESATAMRREAAANALGRLGPAGRREIALRLGSADSKARALAALAAAQSWDEDAMLLLRKALGDRDASVRSAAVAGLGAVQATLVKSKEKLLPDLRTLASSDPDAGVRASAALAIASISPENPE